MSLPNQNNTNLEKDRQPLVAGLYARVSTGRQENEKTIESQLAEIRKRVKDDGNRLPSENVFIDDGWSGEMLQRPGLDSMRDAATEGVFQALYVYDRGRLARKFHYQELVIEELTEKDIKFVTLHDITAETPEEKVLQAMQGVFHEYERIKIAERMRRGKLYKARQGVIINGQAKYGWRYIKKNGDKPARIEINEEEARIVRMIWDWYGNERVSIREIIRRLYDMGVRPRRRRSKFWTKGPITRLLSCESYVTGVIYYNKSEAVVPKHPIKKDKYKKVKKSSRRLRPKEEWIPHKITPIIDDYGLYQKIIKRLEFNKKYARKNRKYDYLLRGLIWCGCGNKRAGDGQNKHGHFYYRCAERIYKFPKKDRKCRLKGVNAQVLDAKLWKELTGRLTSRSLIRKYAKEWLAMQKVAANNGGKEKQKLQDLITKIEEEEGRYAKAYGSGSLDFGQFNGLMKEPKRRKLSLQKQLEELEGNSAQISLEFEVDDLIKEAKRVVDSLDLSNKFQTVQDIIGKVIVKERRQVEIWAHIPLQTAFVTEKLGYEPDRRNRRFTECGEVNVV